MNYLVYDEATGRILRVGECPASMLDIQAGPGEVAVEGDADTAYHEIDLATLTVRKKSKPEVCGDAPSRVASPYMKTRGSNQ